MFAEDGASIPVTVLSVAANRVVQVKTKGLTVMIQFKLLSVLKKLTV